MGDRAVCTGTSVLQCQEQALRASRLVANPMRKERTDRKLAGKDRRDDKKEQGKEGLEG